jgi:hypothetical protein
VTRGRLRADAVVFDLDGTLLDTMTAVPAAYVQAIRELGGPDLTPQELVASWHLGPTPVLLAHYLERPVTARDLDQFHARMAAGTAATQLFPGIADLLGALRDDGYALAVYTSATRRGIEPAWPGPACAPISPWSSPETRWRARSRPRTGCWTPAGFSASRPRRRPTSGMRRPTCSVPRQRARSECTPAGRRTRSRRPATRTQPGGRTMSASCWPAACLVTGRCRDE